MQHQNTGDGFPPCVSSRNSAPGCRNDPANKRKSVHVGCLIMENQIIMKVIWTRSVRARSKDLKGSKLEQKIVLHEVEPLTLQALHKLVALVHDSVKVADRTEPVHSTSGNDSDVKVKDEQKRIVASNLFHLEDDPLAKILWTLEPLTLQNVFLAMVHNFPRKRKWLLI